MISNKIKIFLIITNLSLILTIILGIISFGSGWHIPEEILSGTFRGSYNFSNEVTFQNRLSYEIGDLGPFTSCKDILDRSTEFTIFRLNNGIYKINPSGIDEFEVYCDMITDGGGWTFLWKNYGGPEATGISNEDLLVLNQNDLVIPQKNGGEFNSEINTNAWNYFKDLESVELIKLASYKNRPNSFTITYSDDLNVWDKINLDLGESVTFSDLFDFTNENIIINSDGDGCLKLDNQVEMFIDDFSYGKSDYLFLLNLENNGFANNYKETDSCGEVDQNNLMSNWGARHVISYEHKSNGRDAVRCQFQCFDGTENYWIETAWGIREK